MPNVMEQSCNGCVRSKTGPEANPVSALGMMNCVCVCTAEGTESQKSTDLDVKKPVQNCTKPKLPQMNNVHTEVKYWNGNGHPNRNGNPYR